MAQAQGFSVEGISSPHFHRTVVVIRARARLCWFLRVRGVVHELEEGVSSGVDNLLILLFNSFLQGVSRQVSTMDIANAGSDVVMPRGNTANHLCQSTLCFIVGESTQIELSNQNYCYVTPTSPE